jgi:hypothetical protein
MEDKRMKSQELITLGSTLVVLGMIFGGEDRLIAYSFIGLGVLLSVISMIKSRRRREKFSMEVK